MQAKKLYTDDVRFSTERLEGIKITIETEEKKKKVPINDIKEVSADMKDGIIKNIKAYIVGTALLERNAREVWDADEILSSTDANHVLIRLTELGFFDKVSDTDKDKFSELKPIAGDTITAHVCLFFTDVIRIRMDSDGTTARSNSWFNIFTSNDKVLHSGDKEAKAFKDRLRDDASDPLATIPIAGGLLNKFLSWIPYIGKKFTTWDFKANYVCVGTGIKDSDAYLTKKPEGREVHKTLEKSYQYTPRDNEDHILTKNAMKSVFETFVAPMSASEKDIRMNAAYGDPIKPLEFENCEDEIRYKSQVVLPVIDNESFEEALRKIKSTVSADELKHFVDYIETGKGPDK